MDNHGFEAEGEVVACTDTECTIRFQILVPPECVSDRKERYDKVLVDIGLFK